MLFPTVTFAVFFSLVLVGVWALAGHRTSRSCFLLAASAVFYGWFDTRFVALLAAAIVLNWALARVVARSVAGRRRAWLVAGVTADVAVLAFFKYYGFFTDSVTSALHRVGLAAHPPLLEVLLPVGISFWTFQAISYLIEVHRHETEPASLLEVATWMGLFATVTAGPITRASELVPQLRAAPDAAHVQAGRAYWLISRGLLKKLVIASYLSSAITETVFANPETHSSLVVLVGIYAYAAQIYADFSGYTDLAIGLSLLLGLRLPENFDRPYTATSVQDFWSRWHMTLTRFLRDYLFAPLARRSRGRPAIVGYAAIVFVMLVAGLWHGAAWGFVMFGAVHGVAMAGERWSRDRRRARGRKPAPRTRWRLATRRFVTFQIVCLGWVFFAAGSVGRGVDVLRALVANAGGAAAGITPLLVATVAGVIAVQYVPADLARRVRDTFAVTRPVVQVAGFTAALVAVAALAPTTVPAFIYYRF